MKRYDIILKHYHIILTHYNVILKHYDIILKRYDIILKRYDIILEMLPYHTETLQYQIESLCKYLYNNNTFCYSSAHRWWAPLRGVQKCGTWPGEAKGRIYSGGLLPAACPKAALDRNRIMIVDQIAFMSSTFIK
jgi:hypothetical protein